MPPGGELGGAPIDRYLPEYDVAITEHLVIDAPRARTYQEARNLDFMTVRSPLLTTSFFVRALPARLRCHRRARLGQDRLPLPRPARR